MDVYQWIKVFALGGIVASGMMLIILAYSDVGRVHKRVVDGLYAVPWGLMALSLGVEVWEHDSPMFQGLYAGGTAYAGYVAFTRAVRAWRPQVRLPHDPVIRRVSSRIDRWAEGKDKPEAPKPQT